MTADHQGVDALDGEDGRPERRLVDFAGHYVDAFFQPSHQLAGAIRNGAGIAHFEETVEDLVQRARVQVEDGWRRGYGFHGALDGAGVDLAEVAQVLGDHKVGGGGLEPIDVEVVGALAAGQDAVHLRFDFFAGHDRRVDAAAADDADVGGLRRIIAEISDADDLILQPQGEQDFGAAGQQRANTQGTPLAPTLSGPEEREFGRLQRKAGFDTPAAAL